MKVLITIAENEFYNPYVRTLAKGLREQGVDVTCSSREFWYNWQSYDIIHIQWPHILIMKHMKNIAPLVYILQAIKKSNVKIVATCHNLCPHYLDNPLHSEAYKLVYEYADAITHLGDYSLRLFLSKYPNAVNIKILHHIYDDIYSRNAIPTREEACEKLGLSPSYKYVVCMGAFRNESEKKLLHYLDDECDGDAVKVLAPRFLKRFRFSIRHPFEFYYSIRDSIILKLRYRNVICKNVFVPDELVPYYYAASDIAMIQRTSILNSGNVPMALMMGKVVVGPDQGNVGTWLKELNNPIFSPEDPESIKNAVKSAFEMEKKNFGIKNQKYAFDNLQTEHIAKKYVSLYTSIS